MLLYCVSIFRSISHWKGLHYLCQSQTFRSLRPYVLLNLEMVQVQKVKLVHETKFSLRNLLFNTYLVGTIWIVLFFADNLLKPLNVNFVQKCLICVICENLECVADSKERASCPTAECCIQIQRFSGS